MFSVLDDNVVLYRLIISRGMWLWILCVTVYHIRNWSKVNNLEKMLLRYLTTGIEVDQKKKTKTKTEMFWKGIWFRLCFVRFWFCSKSSKNPCLRDIYKYKHYNLNFSHMGFFLLFIYFSIVASFLCFSVKIVFALQKLVREIFLCFFVYAFTNISLELSRIRCEKKYINRYTNNFF